MTTYVEKDDTVVNTHHETDLFKSEVEKLYLGLVIVRWWEKARESTEDCTRIIHYLHGAATTADSELESELDLLRHILLDM